MATIQYLINIAVKNAKVLDDLATSAEAANKALGDVQDTADRLNTAMAGQAGGVRSLAAAYNDLRDAAAGAALAQKAAAGAAAASAADSTGRGSAAGAAAGGALGFLGWLKIAHLAVSTFGAQVAADAVGLTAFGVAATSALRPVVANWGTLTTTWGALDKLQKGFVLNLQSYLAALQGGGHEAGVFTVLNEGVAILRSFTGSGNVVGQAVLAFQRLGTMLDATFTGPGWQALLHGTGALVGKDLTALFGLINEIIGVLPSLVRGFNSVGLVILSLLGHGVGLVGWFLSLNKGFSDFLAIGGAVLTTWSLLAHFIGALPGPMAVLGPVFTRLTGGVAGLTGVFTNFRMFGLVPTLGLLTGLGPEMLAALGPVGLFTAAIVAIGLAAADNRDPVQNLIDGIQKSDQAALYSIPVWQHGADVLNQHASAAGRAATATADFGSVQSRLAGPTGAAYTQLQRLTPALQAQQQGVSRLQANYAYLENTYGVTATQAAAIMRAVNLGTGALTGNSQAARENRFQIANWVKTQQQALSPLSQFGYDLRQINEDMGNQAARTQDLANAYTALLGPLTGVETAAGNLWPSLKTLTQAVKADGTEVSLWTPKGADLAGKLSTATTNATALSTAIFNQTGNVDKSIKPLTTLVDLVEKLHLRGADATATVNTLVTAQAALYQKTGLNISAVAALISKLDHIPLIKVLEIIMKGKGSFTVVNLGGGRSLTSTGQVRGFGGHTGSPGGGPGGAAGMFITHGTTPTADDVIARVSKGELIVPAHMVRTGAVDHLRGRIPGFASGGYLGTGPAGISGLGTYTQSSYSSFQTAMTSAMVAAMRSAIKQAASFPAFGGGGPSGGSASAAARYAMSLLGRYGWGGQWAALNYVAMAESGWDMYARNPSSGAYGIAQFINGPGEYYQYGGNPNTIGGQVTAFLNYIRARYGSPNAAAAHEQTYHWYDQGGIISEPILGMGASGTVYGFGGNGPETVIPGAPNGSTDTLLSQAVGLLNQLVAETRATPGRTGEAVGGALDGVARGAYYRGRYSTR